MSSAIRSDITRSQQRDRESLRDLIARDTQAPSADDRVAIAAGHFRLGDLAASRHWFRKALDLDPENQSARENLARVASMLGDLEIRDDRSLNADTWNSLAQNQYNRGNFRVARKLFELAIEADPTFIKAYYNLSELIRAEDIDDWIARLETHPPANSSDSPELQFLLASLYDRKSDYRRAVELYKRANQLKYEQAPKEFDTEKYSRLVDSIIEYFSEERIRTLQRRLAALPLKRPRIIFVVGLPRSGSTLASRILASQPSARDLGEAHFLISGVNLFISHYGPAFPAVLDHLDDDDWLLLQQLYLNPAGGESGILVDKYLENFLFLGIIPALFPGARAVHTVRNRDDVMISCFKRMFPDGVPWSYDIGQMRHYYQEYRRLMRHWQDVLPRGTLHDLVYEDLVQDQDKVIGRLAAQCGLDPALAKQGFHRRPALVKTASAQQVRKPIYKDALNAFERYRPYISFDQPEPPRKPTDPSPSANR